MVKRLLVCIAISFAVASASACGTLERFNVLDEAKCKTEIAKDSKFVCEFEGKKILGRK